MNAEDLLKDRIIRIMLGLAFLHEDNDADDNDSEKCEDIPDWHVLVLSDIQQSPKSSILTV